MPKLPLYRVILPKGTRILARDLDDPPVGIRRYYNTLERWVWLGATLIMKDGVVYYSHSFPFTGTVFYVSGKDVESAELID